MATRKQIEANRRNSRKSTGPRSPAGKAASSQNALQFGIHAQSLVIRGEDPAALDALIAQYAERFQPATPDEHVLTGALVQDDWLLRRCRAIEGELWDSGHEDAEDCESFEATRAPLAYVYLSIEKNLMRLQQRVNSVERSYHRALARLERLQAARTAALSAPPQPIAANPADPPQPGPTALPPDPSQPKIGFVPQNHSTPSTGPSAAPRTDSAPRPPAPRTESAPRPSSQPLL